MMLCEHGFPTTAGWAAGFIAGAIFVGAMEMRKTGRSGWPGMLIVALAPTIAVILTHIEYC